MEGRQGIGSRNSKYSDPEPITITLNPALSGAINHDCWELCETGEEQVEEGCESPGANAIACVTEVEDGVYEIGLEHPISAGHWTTMTYVVDQSYVTYASLPADANADHTSASADIIALMNYLNEVEEPPHGDYSCDIDHSGVFGSPDINRLIDLLNGAGKFISWNNKSLPDNTCPGGRQSAGQGGSTSPFGGTTLTEADAEFIDGFVTYVATAVIPDAEAEGLFELIVEALTGFCIDNLSPDDRATLADKLQDPLLTFASPLAERMVPEIVYTLLD